MPITISPTRYNELNSYRANSEMMERCEFCIIVACEAVKDDAVSKPEGTDLNTSDNRLWARYALDNPRDEARKVWNLLLADNKSATDAQIEGLNDTQLQNLVNGFVPYLVQARADR